jgi:hypothetical protein
MLRIFVSAFITVVGIAIIAKDILDILLPTDGPDWWKKSEMYFYASFLAAIRTVRYWLDERKKKKEAAAQ